MSNMHQLLQPINIWEIAGQMFLFQQKKKKKKKTVISSSVDTLSSESDREKPKKFGINNQSLILTAHVIAE